MKVASISFIYRLYSKQISFLEELLVKSVLYKSLLIEIGIKRQDMYRKANDLGLSHPSVVACSQELDRLLNKYQQRAS